MAKLALPSALPSAYRGREQTYVKHLVLREYLERVAWNILSFKDDFVFVDGFSGPWKAVNEDFSDTSFGIAIERLRSVKASFAERRKHKNLRCIFVEKRSAAYKKLQVAAGSAQDLQAVALRGTFEENIGEIDRLVGAAFTLTFVDPTGWSFDLRKLAPLLSRRSGEVLVNFMYEHFRRFIEDKRSEIRSSQNLAFGDGGWREEYEALLEQGVPKEDAILGVFTARLKTVCGFEYVATARVQNPVASKTHFHLVYGTHHPKGLIEFRRVEKEAMLTQEHCRSEAKATAKEARTGQATMFADFDAVQTAKRIEKEDPRRADLARARQWVLSAVERRDRPYRNVLVEVLQRYSVTEPELKDALVQLRNDGRIDFVGIKPRQLKPDNGVTIVSALVNARAIG
jgi:three-Cys-motif partner protein